MSNYNLFILNFVAVEMGNVQVQYKQRRGANEAGTDITDPKEYL